MQAARRGQVEPLRITAQFDKNRGKRRQPRGFLGDPQRIGELRRLRQENVFRRYAKALLQPRRIGKGRLAKDFRRADPQHRGLVSLLLQDQADKGKHEPRRCTGVARFSAMNFGQSGFR